MPPAPPRLARVLCRPRALDTPWTCALRVLSRTCSNHATPSQSPTMSASSGPDKAPEMPESVDSAREAAALNMPAAVTALREAVAEWSAVEKQKVRRARRHAVPAAPPATAVSAGLPSIPMREDGASPSLTPDLSTASAKAANGTDTTSSTTEAPAAAAPSWGTDGGTDFDVRNKRDQFWEFIYTGPPTAPPATPAASEDAPPDTPVATAVDVDPPATVASTAGGGGSSTPPAKVTFSSVRQSTNLGRSRPTIHPFRSRPKRRVATHVAQVVNLDPNTGVELVAMMSAESRRLMVVMGTASEYFGGSYGDVVEQVKMADRDRDRLISSEEYDDWASNSFQRRPGAAATTAAAGGEQPSRSATTTATAGNRAGGGGQHASVVRAIQRHPDASSGHTDPKTRSVPSPPSSPSFTAGEAAVGSTVPSTTSLESIKNAAAHFPSLTALMASEAVRTAASGGATKPSSSSSSDPGYIKWSTWWKLVLVAAPPFFAFGLLDNMTFVLSGDAIDRTMSNAFQLSEMAAAALGGVVSGVAGIQVHGLAEKYTRTTPPPLSAAQKRSPSYHRAEHTGNSMGMVLGLIVGMVPLLWLHKYSEDEQNEDIEHDIALMREEAKQSVLRRVQREDKLRHLLAEHEHSEWDAIMKQAHAEHMKLQMSHPTRTPDNLDDRHNPH